MILLALLAWSSPTFAQNTPSTRGTITVGSVVNGTSGGVIVGPPEGVRARLLKVMGERGIAAMPPAREDGAEIDPGSVRFVLNGVVVDQACHRESHWTGCRWRIQWSILDRLTERIALETTTSAEASVNQSNATSEMYVEIVARAALPLARAPELRAILDQPAASEASAAERWPNPVPARPCPGDPLALPDDLQAIRAKLFTFATERGRGVGTVISADGVALASAQAIGGATEVSATFADETSSPATVVRVDRRANLAVLHLADRNGECLVVDPKDLPLGTPVNGLGTRDGGPNWGLRTGAITATLAQPSGLRLMTDAAVGDLAPGSPLLSADGQVVGIGMGADTPPLAAVSAVERVHLTWTDAPGDRTTVIRSPIEPEPVRLDLEPMGAPLSPPIGPGRLYESWSDVPGATESIVGGGLVGLGVLVAVPSAVAWSNEQGGFDVDPTRRATYGALTGIGVLTAAGGGYLLYKGWEKSQEAGTKVIISTNQVGVAGRF